MHNRKTRILTLLVVILASLLLSQIIAGAVNKRYEEPERNKGRIPENLVWNEETGGYYDPSEYTWDSERGAYKESFSQPELKNGTLSRGQQRLDWCNSKKDSTKKLEQALVKYFEYWRANPSFSSVYKIENDKAMKYLVELGEEHIPEMLAIAKNEYIWAGTLLHAIEIISGIDVPPGYHDGSEEGLKKWIGYVEEKLVENGLVEKE